MEAEDLVRFTVAIEQTDLCILAERDLTDEATRAARRARCTVEAWLDRVPEFAAAIAPLPCPTDAPRIIREMSAAGEAAQVGPMAAVAGAVAESVARDLAEHSREVIVENGGDTYLVGSTERVAGIFAGESPLSNRLGLVLPAELLPVAVCTSSGTVGPSMSLGKADAVVVVARNGALADAVATGTANKVSTPADIEGAVEWAAGIEGIEHVVAIVGDRLAAWGGIEMRKLTAQGGGDAPEKTCAGE